MKWKLKHQEQNIIGICTRFSRKITSFLLSDGGFLEFMSFWLLLADLWGCWLVHRSFRSLNLYTLCFFQQLLIEILMNPKENTWKFLRRLQRLRQFTESIMLQIGTKPLQKGNEWILTLFFHPTFHLQDNVGRFSNRFNLHLRSNDHKHIFEFRIKSSSLDDWWKILETGGYSVSRSDDLFTSIKCSWKIWRFGRMLEFWIKWRVNERSLVFRLNAI